MFNVNLFNQVPFNYISLLSATTPQWDIVYNDYNLQNWSIIISSTSFDNWNSISSDTYSNPLTDLWWELNYFFREKIVRFTWSIKADTAELFNNKIDEFKKILWQNNKNLDIKVNWTIRRAKASCINLNSMFERKHYNITWMPFVLEFRVVAGFFKELTKQSQGFIWLTAWFIEEITNRGSIRTNPTLNILINSTTWSDEIVFWIWEDEITINESLNDSDIILIDCEEKTVKINNIEVDYTGVFPILEVWVNSYTIAINWTVNYNTTLSYFNNFI